MEAQKIIKYLDKKFAPKLAAPWDNIGVQLYQKQLPDLLMDIEKLLVCLDLTIDVARYAVENNFQLIITRHPLVFGDLATEKQFKKELFALLDQKNVLVFSIHTNYDASPNQNLLALIDEKLPILKSRRFGVDKEGYFIRLKQTHKLTEFLHQLAEIFSSTSMQVNNVAKNQSVVEEFYLVPGSGGDSMLATKLTNSLLVTGELKWNHLMYANNHQNSLVLLGHYMEQTFVNDLVGLLTNNFGQEIKIEGFDIQNQLFNIERK